MKKNAVILILVVLTVSSLAVAYHKNRLVIEYRLQLLETELKLKETQELAEMQRRIAERNQQEAMRQREIAIENQREAIAQRARADAGTPSPR